MVSVPFCQSSHPLESSARRGPPPTHTLTEGPVSAPLGLFLKQKNVHFSRSFFALLGVVNRLSYTRIFLEGHSCGSLASHVTPGLPVPGHFSGSGFQREASREETPALDHEEPLLLTLEKQRIPKAQD